MHSMAWSSTAERDLLSLVCLLVVSKRCVTQDPRSSLQQFAQNVAAELNAECPFNKLA